MEIVRIVTRIRLISTHVKKDKRGTKANGVLVSHWKSQEIGIWLMIGPKTPLGDSPIGSNWVS